MWCIARTGPRQQATLLISWPTLSNAAVVHVSGTERIVVQPRPGRTGERGGRYQSWPGSGHRHHRSRGSVETAGRTLKSVTSFGATAKAMGQWQRVLLFSGTYYLGCRGLTCAIIRVCMALTTRGFESVEQLRRHFTEHGDDFGAQNSGEYERLADRFLGGDTPERVHECVRSGGAIPPVRNLESSIPLALSERISCQFRVRR